MKPPLDPSQVAAAALADAVEFAKEHGVKSKIATELQRLTGRPVSRQMVEKWLHEDPTKRREPLLGAGLALIALCDLMQNDGLTAAGTAPKNGLSTIVQIRYPQNQGPRSVTITPKTKTKTSK